MVVEVLGPCRLAAASVGGRESPLPPLSLTQRKILARLAIDAPAPVSIHALEEAIWGDRPPPSSRPALQNQVSRLRTRVAPGVIVTSDRGYVLGYDADIALVTAELRRAEGELLGGDLDLASRLAAEALARWRGRPLDELDDLPAAGEARRRLDAVGRGLEAVRLEAAIGSGRTQWAVPEAERLVAADADDEHRWALLARALAAAGRRGEALATIQRARQALARSLGLAPGPELRAAEASILEVEPSASARVPRLVGRDREAHDVLTGLEGGGSVLVVGEDGSGKSALLAEVGRRLRRRGHRVLTAGCPVHPPSALSTLVELMEGLPAPDDRLDPVSRFTDAVARSIGDGGPLVLAVDDVDRAGPTTRAALTAVASEGPVSLLLSAEGRTELGMDVAVVGLAPLARADVAALVADLAGTSGDAQEVDWFHEMSGGNPMLVATLVEEATVRAASGAHLPPAPGLRELVRRRLQRLGGPARAALDLAAVSGPNPPDVVLTESAVPVAELVEAGLLEPDPARPGSIRFRHRAVQRVVLDDLSPGERTELHDHVAGLLASRGDPAASIAAHALAAVEVDPSGARRWALAAATAATDEGAHSDAAEWCDRALEVGAGLGERERTEILVRRGDALRLSGSPDQEQALFDAADAAAALGDPTLIAHAAFAALQLGATTESGSMHERAAALAEQALTIVTDDDEWARIAAAASLTYSMTQQPDRCRELFLAAETRATSDSARRQVIPFAYLALGHPRDLDHRARLTDELLASASADGDAQALFEGHQLSFSVGLQQADGPRVRRAVADLEPLTPRVGDVGRRWSLAYQQAALAHLDGDLAASEALAEEALATFVDVSPSRAFATYSAQLLPLRWAAGRLDELRDPLLALVDDQPGVPAWHAALALCLVADDPSAARHHAAVALDDVALDFTWLAAHVVGGRAAAAVGDAELIGRYEARLAPWSGLVCWAGTCAYGPVDTVLALLAAAAGDTATARTRTRSAAETARRLEAPVFVDELDHLALT